MKTSAGIYFNRYLTVCHVIVFWSFLGLGIVTLVSCSSYRRDTQLDMSYDKTYAVASWYGAEFNGRPTSSGETFSMHAKTCAHKRYPFGTILRVTNTSNQKSVQCIVNDRGPFVEGRELDMSYGAAKEIGLVGPGIGRVFIEVDGRDNSYRGKVNIQAKRTGPFAIQIGAFTDNSNAVRLKEALSLRQENVYIQETVVKGTTFYRVRIGNYDSFNQAVSVAEDLAQEGYHPNVMKAEIKI